MSTSQRRKDAWRLTRFSYGGSQGVPLTRVFLKQGLFYCLLGFGTESNEGNPDSGQAPLSLCASFTRASSSTNQNGVRVLVLPLVGCDLGQVALLC